MQTSSVFFSWSQSMCECQALSVRCRAYDKDSDRNTPNPFA